MKLRHVFFCVLGVLVTGVLVTVYALLYLPTDDTSHSAGNYRVTCIIPSRSDTTFWQDIEDSMRQAADELNVDMTMLYVGTEGNLAMPRNDALEIAILSGAQAIVTSLTKSGEETNALLRRAREAGIYVVLIDSDGSKDLRDVFVSIDNRAAGYALGQAALNELEYGKVAVLISSGNQYPNMIEREEGIAEAFQSAPEAFEIINADTQNDFQLAMAVEEFLQNNKNVGTLITTLERRTIVCSQLIRRLDMTGEVALYGFDQSDETMELLNDGDLQALIYQHHSEIGYKGIVTAVDLIKGVTFDSDIRTVEYELLYSSEGKVNK